VLDPLQHRVAQRALRLPAAGRTALAGGGAMLAHGLVNRPTADIDLFSPDEADVQQLRGELVAALAVDGLEVETEVDTDSFVRLGVEDGSGSRLEVEIAWDARLFPPVRMQVGPVISESELAADKTLALFGRAYARDLVDVAALVDRLGASTVLDLAAAKDGGFSIAVFARALEVAARRPDEKFRRLGLGEQETAELREWARGGAGVLQAG
jgi:Nucleotidyl transferase AbiEii toxin, Type IV TA system